MYKVFYHSNHSPSTYLRNLQQLTPRIRQLTLAPIERHEGKTYTINIEKGVVKMKVTIENIPVGSEPEIILRCNEPDDSLLEFIHSINSISKKLIGSIGSQMHMINPKDVFYFESVENKVFIYCKQKVFESRLRLYEIEKEYEKWDFFRASKSTILNVSKIESLVPVFYGKFEALLENGEKVLISRQYVPVLKKILGL